MDEKINSMHENTDRDPVLTIFNDYVKSRHADPGYMRNVKEGDLMFFLNQTNSEKTRKVILAAYYAGQIRQVLTPVKV